MQEVSITMEKLLDRKNEIIKIIDILDGMNPSVEQECIALKTELDAGFEMITKRFELLQKSKALYQEQLKVLKKLDMTQEYLDYIKNNRPKNIRLVKEAMESPMNHARSALCNYSETERMNMNENKESVNKKNYLSVPNNHTKNTVGKSSSLEHLSPLKASMNEVKDVQSFSVSSKHLEISISYITEDELSSISSYMRGRITLQNVNSFIDTYNSVLNKKYALLKKSKSLLKTKKDLDQCHEWRSQEIPATARKYFCTAKDIADLENKKLGTKENSIIVILRHLKRIREHRNKKLTYLIACF